MSAPLPRPAGIAQVSRNLAPGGARRVIEGGTVTAVDEARHRFTVRLDGGAVITLDPNDQGRTWGVIQWARVHSPHRRIIATADHIRGRTSGRFSEHNPERFRTRYGPSTPRATRAEAIADAQAWFDRIDDHLDVDLVDALIAGIITLETAHRIDRDRHAAARELGDTTGGNPA